MVNGYKITIYNKMNLIEIWHYHRPALERALEPKNAVESLVAKLYAPIKTLKATAKHPTNIPAFALR